MLKIHSQITNKNSFSTQQLWQTSGTTRIRSGEVALVIMFAKGTSVKKPTEITGFLMVARAPVDVVDVDVWCSRNASWVPAFFFDFWCWYCYRSINCFRISGAYLKKVSRVLHSDNVWMGFTPVLCFTCPLPTSEGLTVSFTVKRCGVQNQLPWLYFVYDAQRDRALATQIRERKRTV